MDGGIGREWESLVGRYRRMSGAKGVLGDKEVQEVSEKLVQAQSCLQRIAESNSWTLLTLAVRCWGRSRPTSSLHLRRRANRAIYCRISWGRCSAEAETEDHQDEAQLDLDSMDIYVYRQTLGSPYFDSVERVSSLYYNSHDY